MFHHEFIVDNFTVWENEDIFKLEAFASICPVLADQLMVSAFIMNFPGATPLDCKELDKLPRPPPPPALAQSGLCAQLALCHPPTPVQLPTFPRHLLPCFCAMSMLCRQQCWKPWIASYQAPVGLWWHCGSTRSYIFLRWTIPVATVDCCHNYATYLCRSPAR